MKRTCGSSGCLLLGDAKELIKLEEDESYDLIITDPPYGVGSGDKFVSSYDDAIDPFYEILEDMYRVLKKNTRLVFFSSQKNYCEMKSAVEHSGFYVHQTLVWHRPNLFGGTRKKTYEFTNVNEWIVVAWKGSPQKANRVDWAHNTDVLKYAVPQSNFKRDKRIHVHQKPLDLIRHLILAYTNKDGRVLDPFAGSGTTAIAAEMEGRQWTAYEINEEFFMSASLRIMRYHKSRYGKD